MLYINKQAGKTRGDAPPGNFLKLDALKLLLDPFMDRSRAIVASNFWLSYMHLLSQLTSNFYERRCYEVGITLGGVTSL